MDVTDESVALEDASTNDDGFAINKVVGLIEERLDTAKRERRTTETRWSDAYDNFRGHYNSRVKFQSTEKSRAFVKITKTKVMAAYGQILEILLSTGKLPIGVEPTPVPIGSFDPVHISVNDPKESDIGPESPEDALEEPSPDPYGYVGDDNDLEPGATLSDRLSSSLKKIYKGAKIKMGVGVTAEDQTIDPTRLAADKMTKKLQDMLTESDAVTHVCRAVFESILLGTGVIKGPMLKRKEYPRWTEEGEYDPIFKVIGDYKQVSVWDFYVDPSATNTDDVEWSIERHRLTKSSLRDLRMKPFFRKDALASAIELGAQIGREWWEHALNEEDIQLNNERYEVLEYWGTMDTQYIEEELEEKLPESMKDLEEVLVNAWICNGQVIRLVLNPFKPSRSPYHIFTYEEDLYNFWGVGVAENMADSQVLMNGFTRLAVDNAVVAGSMMIEVDESNLAPGQSMEIYPGKIWRRMGGAPGQAIFGIKWPSTANENMQMFDKFRQLADDSTGIPSFSHGQTGVSGIGRTASGISMLMGAANLNTKTAMKSIDKMLASVGHATFAFLMQFDPDPEIKGDLEVKATGTASLVAKEVLTQKLLQLQQLAQDPANAPFANREGIWRETVKSLDLDDEKLTLDPKQAAIQAQLLATTSPAAPEQANAAMQNNPAAAMAQGGPAGLPAPGGAQNGGGNIAPATPDINQNQPQG
tara:strand:+ start:2706 stop:4805 length:2100 start_codon:yes stop_codon:yes gene_type:complete